MRVPISFRSSPSTIGATDMIGKPVDCGSEVARHLDILKAMMKESESGFLSVGSHLRQIHSGTQDISSKLSGLMNAYSDNAGEFSLTDLRPLAERATSQLDSFNEYSRKAAGSLESLEKPLMSLPDSLREFDRLVSRLRKMGIVARIEASRLGEGGRDFVRLAEAVTSLGEQITSKAKDVYGYIRGVNDVIQSNKSRMRDMIDKHGEVSRQVSKYMESNLAVLTSKKECIKQSASSISVKSDDAMGFINKIVQSIQYHDITRQQVEHIIQALSTVAALDSVTESIPVCEIQAAQLKRVGNEFEEAVETIAESLHELSGAVTIMFDETVNITGSTSRTGGTFIDDVESGLEIVSATMLEDQFAVDNVSASLRQIGENIRQMKSFMDEMAEIGSEIELLALNSRIKAAKAGSDGATLGVIAESIENLSMGTLDLVGKVIDRMSTMVAASNNLSDDRAIDTVTSKADQEISEIIGTLNATVRMFHDRNTASAGIFLETREMCSAIVEQLECLISVIEEHRGFAATLVSTGNSLETLVRTMRSGLNGSSRIVVDERLERLRKEYTMETERSTFTSVLNGDSGQATGSSEAAGSIELF